MEFLTPSFSSISSSRSYSLHGTHNLSWNFFRNHFSTSKTAFKFIKLQSSRRSNRRLKSTPANRIRSLDFPRTFENQSLIPKTSDIPKIPRVYNLRCLQNHISTTIEQLPSKFFFTQFPNCSIRLNYAFACPLFVASMAFMIPFSSLATEISSEVDEFSNKINLESILTSMDNFFNKYPFFVAGVAFIWLIVIPLSQEFGKRFKPVSALDAFGKLKSDKSWQLIDIRTQKSLKYLPSPNLKSLNKSVVQVEFVEGEEDAFVRKVKENFRDMESIVPCILDNFDGNSLKVAELLCNNGFKEAYGIKGGLRGKEGWQEIQENFLPPSLHVLSAKAKAEISKEFHKSSVAVDDNDNKVQIASPLTQSDENIEMENADLNQIETSTKSISSTKPSSPYPNYPDFKPPSSPTPSKPQA